ncbi:MAG TPA: Xaa-Pro peptidase family protein [Thermoleophilia bacterium]|nr:Xaa-Pro peptidase family protein [Thermoleophilia bacterium]
MPVPGAEVERRLIGLRAALDAAGVEAALIVQNADLYYYAGTVQQSHLYVPSDGEPTLFTRKTVARAREETPLEVVPLNGVGTLPAAILDRYGALPRQLGFELDVLPVNQLRRYEALFPEAQAVDVSPLIVRQRAVKSSWEVERIRAAGAVTIAVSERLPEILAEGMTEAELAGRLEGVARSLGHQGVIRMRGFNQEMFYGQLLTGASGEVASFLDTPLAGTGLSPAIAQGVSFRRIARGDAIVFDFVSVVDGYTADFTRMYVIGSLDRLLEETYDVALRVQEAVIARARPGTRCRELYETAVAVADEAGLAESFMGYGEGQVRFVGHGVGLELDELPVLSANDLTLEKGMVFALEPKFVLPGRGAVGLENTWLVTGGEPETLTLAPEHVRHL